MRRGEQGSARSLVVLGMILSLIATLFIAPVSAEGREVPKGDGKPEAGEVAFWLTVLHNNDGESAIIEDEGEGGVNRFATVVRQAKKHAKRARFLPRGERHGVKSGVLLVSSGDNFLASPSFAASEADGIFYDAIALDRLRYDAIAIGNHDFDFGPDLLADFIMDFRKPGRPPYVSANLDFSGEPALQALVDKGVIRPATIVRERGQRIGIVGATTPNLPFISSPGDVIVMENVAEIVQRQVNRLRRHGVNKIILISHLQGIGEDIELASMLRGVDIMVAGGGDELLASPGDLLLPSDQLDEENNETGEPGPDGIPDELFGDYPQFAVDAAGRNVPVVTTAGSYGYLGRLVVGFDKRGHIVEIDDDASGPIRVVSPAIGPDGVRENRRMDRKVTQPVEAFVEALASTVIATSEVELDGRRSQVRSRETNEGNLIADSQLWAATELATSFGAPVPDVAVQNGGGIRNDSIIPAGPITLLDTFDMVPFPNFVTVMEGVDRDVFLALLENAVSRIDASGDAVGSGTGRFAQVAGFEFSYNSAVPAGSRVIDVTLDDGTPIVVGGVVQPGADLNVAVVDFTARGGDEYDWGDGVFTVLGISYQQALEDYIVEELGGVISAADYPEGGEGRITRVT